MRDITTKYNSNHKNHRYKLVEESKKRVNRIFIDEKWQHQHIKLEQDWDLNNMMLF